MGGGKESVVIRRSFACLAALVLLVGFGGFGRPRTAWAHPLHTSLAEISYDSRSGHISVTLRVFVDDFTNAANLRRRQLAARGVASGNSPLVEYAQASFSINEASGRRVALRFCGGRRAGDLMWLCLRGTARPGRRQLMLTNQILFDLFRDQINIVKVTMDGRTRNLLFISGDKAKPLA